MLALPSYLHPFAFILTFMFIDSHAHIDGPEFDADREEVIERAHAAGVSVILNVGTGDPHSGAFERAVELG